MATLSLDSLSGRVHLLSDDERAVQSSVRRLVRERFLPLAAAAFEAERFPSELVPELANLGLLGGRLHGYGCAGLSAVAYGVALEELEYGDSGLRSFVSVQGSLVMHAIHAFGSEGQKTHFLPQLAAGQMVGCFGLTEPESGSDPSSLTTRARRDGTDYVLDGIKHCESGMLRLEFNEKTSPGKFTLGENYIYVVMPITIDA